MSPHRSRSLPPPPRPACLLAAALWLAAAAAAQAFEPAFSAAAAETAAEAPAPATLDLPTGPFDGSAVPTRALDGEVRRRAWRIEAPGTATLDLLAPLEAQLLAQGYRVVFGCETTACGGFDFRFAVGVLPEPGMHVDLGDFRFLAAERAPGEAVTLLVSRSETAGFVQVSSVRPGRTAAPDDVAAAETAEAAEEEDEVKLRDLSLAPAAPVTAPAPAPGSLGEALDRDGHAVLDGVVFAPGSVTLEDGDAATLVALADWLKADGTRRVVLVGHTDAEGGLATNIALSKRRAQAVRAKLLAEHGIDAGRVVAEGVGYLSPRTTNATEEGRARNRRVEVVVLSPG